MMQNKTFEEFKGDLRQGLEHLAVLRRVGLDLGFSKEEIDMFIAEEGAKQTERFESKSEAELMIYMLNDIMENAPDEIKESLSKLMF